MKLGSLFSGAGLLPWLNDVDVDGWRFWALAGSVDGLVREALIDLDELRVIRWVTR